jgi:hypothetical protein
MNRTIKAMVLALTGLAAFAGATRGGPATYDKDSKSFTFRYTFTTLASGGDNVGAVTKPTTEQEQNVRNLVSAVSQVLSQATEGRATVGRLDYVDDVKDADIVISLTGNPASAGVSQLSASDGKPGHILLYYQTLLPEIRQDVIFTVVHELGHYLFGLMDEYRPDLFPGGCPNGRPGPGCLMDNYLSGARGWMGRFCRATEHNKEAAQPQSCQEIVDKFFADRGVLDKDANAAGIGGGKQAVITAALGQVRAEATKRTNKRGASTSSSSLISGLASFARKTLTSLISDFNQDNPNKAIFTPDQIKQAVDLITKAGSVLPVGKPSGLKPEVFDMIVTEAQRLGQEFASKTPTSRQTAVRSGLNSFLKSLLTQNQFAPENFDANEQKLLVNQLAQKESRSDQDKALDQIMGVGNVSIQLEREIAQNIVTILDELDAPGTRKRLDFLVNIDKQLKLLSIPGRTSSGFGLRRSRFITPDPISTDFQYVLTQGGVFPYNDVRDRGFINFSRLISRERIELVRPRFGANAVSDRPLAVRIDRPLEPQSTTDFEVLRQQSNEDLGAFLSDVFNNLERNRLENITILVPPGGLPVELSQLLRVFKTKLRDNYDVRLDVVLTGAADIPDELRDLCVRSLGSVISLTDIDELGAIAQRLKNEQSSGCWVIIPQQSSLPSAAALVAENQAKTEAGRISDEIVKRTPAYTAMIKKATDSLSDAVSATPPLTEPARTQVDYANTNTKAFDGIIQQLRSSIDPKSIDLTKTDEDTHRKVAGVVLLIGTARDQLKRLEASLQLSAKRKDLLAQATTTTATTTPAPTTTTPTTTTKLSADQALLALATFSDEFIRPKSDKDPTSKLDDLKAYLRLYELWLVNALTATKDDRVPIYHRLDRSRLDSLLKAAQTAQASATGGAAVDKLLQAKKDTEVPLARFYVEKGGAIGDFNIELIVGLSRPLPKIWNTSTKMYESRVPALTLYSDNGQPVSTSDSDARIPTYDRSTSTETLLVYRVQDPTRIPEGWYTPVLGLDKDVLDLLKNPLVAAAGKDAAILNDLNFTFSVGSLRPNVRLTASLIQPENAQAKGVLYAKDKATIEVLLSAGSPVRFAQVVGYYQRIIKGNAEINTYVAKFSDDGTNGDRVKDDGIYTGEILLGDVQVDTELRVFVQADTTDGKARFIALDDPNRDDGNADTNGSSTGTSTGSSSSASKKDDATRTKTLAKAASDAQKATTAAEGEVFKFQRATSVHFLVKH